MILALAGLHGSGKSHFASRIATKFHWKTCVKRDLLKLLHEREGFGDDWVAWYRALYSSIGAYNVTLKLLDLIPQKERLILDSVHDHGEWNALKKHRSNVLLATIIAPKEVRLARNGPEDEGLDTQRIQFWHTKQQESLCLITQSEWCFNGAASAKVQDIEFSAFCTHFAID